MENESKYNKEEQGKIDFMKIIRGLCSIMMAINIGVINASMDSTNSANRKGGTETSVSVISKKDIDKNFQEVMNKLNEEQEKKEEFINVMKNYIKSEKEKEKEDRGFLYEELESEGISSEEDVEKNLEKILKTVNKYFAILEVERENSMSYSKVIFEESGNFYIISDSDKKIKVLNIEVEQRTFDSEMMYYVKTELEDGSKGTSLISKEMYDKYYENNIPDIGDK